MSLIMIVIIIPTGVRGWPSSTVVPRLFQQIFDKIRHSSTTKYAKRKLLIYETPREHYTREPPTTTFSKVRTRNMGGLPNELIPIPTYPKQRGRKSATTD